MVTDGRQKALETTLAGLNKRYGDGAVMKLGDASKLNVETIPTGSLSLDIALGVGGLPRGRIVEIYGPESSGKTTLCLHVIAEAQRRGGVCGFIDVEHALDPAYAARIGVDVHNLYVAQPDTGEQALEIAEALVRSGALDVVAVDSVAALVPRAEIEGEMGDSHMGLQARLMSQALRKLTGVVKSSNTCLIFTNQLRQKIGVMFGNPETTTGGMALKFYASVRLDVRRIQSIKQGNEAVGNRTRVTVKKNKVAPPFKVAEFDIMYNEGISTAGDLVDLGVEHDIISKRGAFYSFGDIRLGQGRENAKTFLAENPDICNEIDRRIRDAFGLAANLAPAGVAAPATSALGDAVVTPIKPKAVQAAMGLRPAVDDESIRYGGDEAEALDDAA
jgi:recombination protein RecA